MTIFWNEGVEETSPGLDILGVRGADQALEAELTGGITTISTRARYLSLLPWFLDEWYRRALVGGKARHDEEAQLAALRRLEKVVLLATVAGRHSGESGDTRGVLGSDLWVEDLNEIEHAGVVDLSTSDGGASLGIYKQPSIRLGLLMDCVPIGVTTAGRELATARRIALRDMPIVESIFNGGLFDSVTALACVPHFSANGLAAPESARERDILVESVTAMNASPLGLGAMVRWALRVTSAEPITSARIISNSFRDAVANDPNLTVPSLAYARFDMLRRIHFALELCLQAICAELLEAGPRDVKGIARRFGRESQQTLVDLGISASATPLREVSISEFFSALNRQKLIDSPYVSAASRAFAAASQAAYAVAQIRAAVEFVSVNAKLAPREDGAAHRAMTILSAPPTRCAQEVLQNLLAFAAERHLLTTFRKMAAGMPCSLRFVSDGRQLQPTDQSTRAGMSAQRLTSLLIVLSDLGFLVRGNDGFTSTQRGRVLVTEVAS